MAASSPEGAVGRTVGTFAAVQTTALVASPLIGGLAGEISWRLAFLAPAVAALALAALPLPGASEAQADPPRLRSALTARVGWLSTAAFLGYLSIAGLGFLVALRAADAFGLGSTERGALVASFGLAGALVGRWAGEFADRRGRVTAALVGAARLRGGAPVPRHRRLADRARGRLAVGRDRLRVRVGGRQHDGRRGGAGQPRRRDS